MFRVGLPTYLDATVWDLTLAQSGNETVADWSVAIFQPKRACFARFSFDSVQVCLLGERCLPGGLAASKGDFFLPQRPRRSRRSETHDFRSCRPDHLPWFEIWWSLVASTIHVMNSRVTPLESGVASSLDGMPIQGIKAELAEVGLVIPPTEFRRTGARLLIELLGVDRS